MHTHTKGRWKGILTQKTPQLHSKVMVNFKRGGQVIVHIMHSLKQCKTITFHFFENRECDF